MYPSYGNPRVNKRCFILNSNINLACHIFKDVATRRTKIETGWQGSYFDSKSLNTKKKKSNVKTRCEQSQNYHCTKNEVFR